MPTQLENIVELLAGYSQEKLMRQDLVGIAKGFSLTLDQLELMVQEARAIVASESTAKIQDRVFRVSEARTQHARNLDGLKSAKPEARIGLLRATSHFAGQAFGARLLEDNEEAIRAAVRACAVTSGMTEEEIQAMEVDWTSGVAVPLKSYTWRDKFHVGSELGEGEVVVHVNGILPEGITAIGSLSAVGKTWFSLSLARALTTGTPFMGVFHVPEAIPVVYLVPEMGERAVRRRLEKLHVPMNDKFYCQTVADGVCNLSDPSLESAVAELRPVIFLDTAVRFSVSDDENSARQNAQSLANDMFQFRRWGARAIVCLHHSPKYAGEAEAMTLENVLRGTGDLGAMCDAVWGLQHDRQKKGKGWDVEYVQESQAMTRIFVRCVKARDFEAAPAFRITGRPYLDSKGDFAVMAEFDTRSIEERIVEIIQNDPKVSIKTLMARFNIGHDRLLKITQASQWMQTKGGWEKVLLPF